MHLFSRQAWIFWNLQILLLMPNAYGNKMFGHFPTISSNAIVIFLAGKLIRTGKFRLNCVIHQPADGCRFPRVLLGAIQHNTEPSCKLPIPQHDVKH